VVEWTELDARGGAVAPLEADATPEARAVAVHRRCRRQVGWTGALETERSSWYLLRDGALVAFDHASFGADCRPHWHVQPARGADRSVERALRRHLAQRHPGGRPDLPEHLDRTRAFLDAGRDERALDALESADLEIERLAVRLDAGGLDDETRLAHQQELDALREARARLVHAMRERQVPGTPAPARPRPGPAADPGTERLLAPGAPAPRQTTPPSDARPEPAGGATPD
jgi:hypothetical protein